MVRIRRTTRVVSRVWKRKPVPCGRAFFSIPVPGKSKYHGLERGQDLVKLYKDEDIDRSLIETRMVGVIGYGSQGHAHALNLKDNGLKVQVGLYQGSSSWEKAESHGLKVADVAETVRNSDIVMLTLPDMIMPKVYKESIEPNLQAGHMLMFAHGFNIHYNQIEPAANVDVTMIAPKAPGHRMRDLFIRGLGVPALLAVEQNPSGEAKQVALAYAFGVGCTRAGVLETTFKEETETDLFGEQSVLCGGVTSLLKAGFETLVEAGYQPEIAYFECLHEMKLIVDLIYQGGLSYMRYSISDTAEYGDYSRGERVLGPEVRDRMREILLEIQNGKFAKEWVAEHDEGLKRFHTTRTEEATHPIETVGKQLRELMPWLKDTV